MSKLAEARFHSGYEVDANGCWIWTRVRDRDGYGRFWDTDAKRQVRAHRYSHELAKGPIPDGLVIDHLCRVTSCVNPEHLEAVTISENTRRGLGPVKSALRKLSVTHCPRGHAYDEANTYHYRAGRYCRACNLAAVKRSKAKRQERAS